MALDTVVLCTDGSELARQAVSAGFGLLRAAEHVLLVTVVEGTDEMAVAGTGMASGAMTMTEAEGPDRAQRAEGQAMVDQVAGALGPANLETHVLQGEPGPALCRFASDHGASAIVMGSRGRGRLKRALLGSVSDYVVRSAPCSVVITPPPHGSQR